MKRKIYKIVILLSVSLLVLFFKSDDSKGCGWFPDPDSYYSIFVPKLFHLPLLKPFFFSWHNYSPYDKAGPLGEKTDNLKLWLKYFNNIPTIDDINYIIYSTKKNDIKEISNYLKTKNSKLLKNEYKNNTLLAYWKTHKYKDDLDYLSYVKKCSPFVVKPDPWENFKRDTSGMYDLIQLGRDKYKDCSNNFLKDRYAFQIIRLAHYSYRYKEAIKLYDKYFGNSNNSLIKYWALEHKAGCLNHLGYIAEANLLFADIFYECPSRRTICSESFAIKSDSIYNATLALCKTVSEKTTVIMLASYNDDVSLSAIKEIYNLDPKSKYLELLLERGISRMERNILPHTYDNLLNYKYHFKYDVTGTYKKFGDLVDSIAQNNNTQHPYLWYLAAGYIYSLNYNIGKAERLFIKAKQLCPKKDLAYINRIKIIVEVISKVENATKIDSNIEANLYKQLYRLRNTEALESLDYKDPFYFIMGLLGAKYYKQNDTVKANLCMGTRYYDNGSEYITSVLGYDIQTDYYKEPLHKIYNFISSTNHSAFEKFLINNYCLSGADIREMIGTKLLLKHKFKEAVKVFKDSGADKRFVIDFKKLPADPFVIHINDCHDCDYEALKDKIYTKLTFAEKMIQLKKLAQTDSLNKAKYYFLLANGYYNMTYYGNSWKAVVYERNFPSWNFAIDTTIPKVFYDCSTAEKYYEKAMKASVDSEFSAKCCFMASKCEQNKFYTNVYNDKLFNHDPKKYFELKNKYRNYFRVLKNQFNETKFYSEAIKECKYFNEFVKNN